MVDPIRVARVMIIVIATTYEGRPDCADVFGAEVEVGLAVADEVELGVGVAVVVFGVGVAVWPDPGTTVICVLAVSFWLLASKTVKVTLSLWDF